MDFLESLMNTHPQATDIHLTEGKAVEVRENGVLASPGLTAGKEDVDSLFRQFLKENKKKDWEEHGAFDAGGTAGTRRLRLHFYRTLEGRSVAVRVLPQLKDLPKDPDEDWIRSLTDLPSGLLLITGATGSGKSTTLARFIEEVNCRRASHIVTLEDPVEYVFTPKKAMIHQREVGRDVSSFADGVRQALREDPDVIVIGELRDRETMAAALMAAETGHLVLGTLHASRAAEAVSRIVHAFQAERENEIRSELSLLLRAAVTQKLCHLPGKTVLLREILVNVPAVAHLIREKKDEQISSYMEMGVSHMRTFRQAAERVRGLSRAGREALRKEAAAMR